jgi:hypothetical protein
MFIAKDFMTRTELMLNDNDMNEIEIFVNRMKKIGIELELVGNIPWIYLEKVNGNRVRYEDYTSDYGYTIAWWPVRTGVEPHLDSDLSRTFDIIRKYRG